MTYLEMLVEQFPVRKSAAQKEAFRAWALRQAEEMGYEAKVEEHSGLVKSRNVVIGDPETAEVTFTAHYDTPAVMLVPNIMMPRNLPLFFAYQFVVIFALIAVTFVVGVLVRLAGASPLAVYWVCLLVYWALLLLMLMGPANKHNVNDNTSGVAAVLELMAKLPTEQRSKTAFILFDNEEKGLVGSKAYAKAHPEVQYTHLIVNMDCVGVGETFLVIASKIAVRLPAYAGLEEALRQGEGRDVKFYSASTSACNSDQKSFKGGVVVVACKKRPVVGYYCTNIHTPRDTVADHGNIDYLVEAFARWVAEM